MNLRQYKVLIIVVAATVALFAASPSLSQLLASTQTDHFTELSLLGPNHDTKTYPYSIKSGQSFTLYLNIDNHLGSTGYYMVRVKFRDQTGSAPNSFDKTSSSMPSLWDIKAVVDNDKSLEIPLTITLIYGSPSTLSGIRINGSLVGTSIAISNSSDGYFGNLFFELWLFNDTTQAYEYNQRYVGIWLNLT